MTDRIDLSNIAYSSEYIRYREEIINAAFKPENKRGSETINEDRVVLEIDNYLSGGEKKHYCGHTKVFTPEGKRLHEYFNLYDQHFLCKLIEYSDGRTYLVYREDLYGYSVFEPGTDNLFNYYPAATFKDGRETFIGTNMHYNIHNNVTAVEGCYWACPSDTVLIKTGNPLEMFSSYAVLHQIIDREYDIYDGIDFVAWEHRDIKLKCYNTTLTPPENEIKTLREDDYLGKMIKP